MRKFTLILTLLVLGFLLADCCPARSQGWVMATTSVQVGHNTTCSCTGPQNCTCPPGTCQCVACTGTRQIPPGCVYDSKLQVYYCQALNSFWDGKTGLWHSAVYTPPAQPKAEYVAASNHYYTAPVAQYMPLQSAPPMQYSGGFSGSGGSGACRGGG